MVPNFAEHEFGKYVNPCSRSSFYKTRHCTKNSGLRHGHFGSIHTVEFTCFEEAHDRSIHDPWFQVGRRVHRFLKEKLQSRKE